MYSWLWTIVALPLAGSLILALLGRRLPRAAVSTIGVMSVGASAVIALTLGTLFLVSPPAGSAYTQPLWTWFSVGPLSATVSLRLDPLSLVMVTVVTVVGFLIHLYSAEYMEDDPDLSRFFAELNLFIASMLILVLASDLLLLYLGWEGVGLCSYLLIGFWYRERANGSAAIKAFVVTRIGDTALLIGIVLLAMNLGTLDIQQLMARAAAAWSPGATLAVLAAALLLIGAIGKSAQIPLQVWLPDAMAGPTPVSALIHAATMVTAGVYLIARTEVLFNLAVDVQRAVAVVGAVTLVIAGFSALVQRDIKRVAAYSTISQLGYMFVALGVGAASAAVFHLFVHAFFKAGIFLGSGAVIHAMDGDHDIFHMGGLKDRMPWTFWTFTISCASLAALPLVTAGFYSKDLILYESLSATHGSVWLWITGLLGALLTAGYASRLVFLVFFGRLKKEPVRRPGWRMLLPMAILAALSVIAGLLEVPKYLGGRELLTEFVRGLPVARAGVPPAPVASLLAAVVVLLGISASWRLYLANPALRERLVAIPWLASAGDFFRSGWGFDALYQAVIVRPYRLVAEWDRDDVLALPYRGLAWLSRWGNRLLAGWQSGRVRTYALGLTIGVVVLLATVVVAR